MTVNFDGSQWPHAVDVEGTSRPSADGRDRQLWVALPTNCSCSQCKQLLRPSPSFVHYRPEPAQYSWAMNRLVVHSPSGHNNEMLCVGHEAKVHGLVVTERRRGVLWPIVVAGAARHERRTA